MLLDTGGEQILVVCVQACQLLCFAFHTVGMAAERWEAARAEGGVVWGEVVYDEDNPLGEPNYEVKETEPADVKNWKKIRREEIGEETVAAAALAEEEAVTLAEARTVEE